MPPFALTKREKKDKARVMRKGGCKVSPQSRFCRLVRCIRKVEKRCREVPKQCPRSPVAVCRATIYSKAEGNPYPKLSLPPKPKPKVQHWITTEEKKIFIGPYPLREAKRVVRKGDIIVRRKRGWIPPHKP